MSRCAPRSVALLTMLTVAAAACAQPGDGAEPSAFDAPVTQGDAAVTQADAGPGGADASGGSTGAAAMCARWNSDRAFREEGAWSGSDAGCVQGELQAPGPDNALRQINLYRWLAGLPPVGLDATKSRDAQACALLMHANGDIEHTVPET